ncbi:hypothetical protein MBGDF03_00909 [Thermoplasmatales archaeon SCGC AB-540-F20]|nr:hypothetical protein MBGDF03_00909 [Thermoplasmatales archaeon SCGC AB-540-F20]
MKKFLTFGIVLLFIVSVVSPIVIGYNAICWNDNAFYSCVEDDSLGYKYGEEHEEEISYYDPPLKYTVGIMGSPPLYWASAIRITEEEMAPYVGWGMTKVIVALSTHDQSEIYANLTIYGEGTHTEPGDIIYQDTGLYFNTTGFHTIELDESISLNDHDEIWIAMWWHQTEEDATIAYCDGGPAIDGKGDWIYSNDTWHEMQPHVESNWGMGAIVECDWAILIIKNIRGPIGVKADVKNTGDASAYNVEWSMTITGGILGLVNKHTSGTKEELPAGAKEQIRSGLFLGLGAVIIKITADADNVEEVTVTRSAFKLGPFVLGII